ncbi:GlxA family transcriptional regulator, partial [Cribrihabitans sp. XS_ASV171]
METEHHFLFALDEGFTMQAFSSAVEVLRLLARIRPGSRLTYGAASLSGGPVRASNGFALIPDTDPGAIPRRAVIVVVAGASANRTEAPDLAAWLRRLARSGHP